MKSILNAGLFLAAAALVGTPSAQAASCHFKLIEHLPVVRVSLAAGSVFDWNSLGDTIWDESKVIKKQKLNGNRFKGSFANLEGRHQGGDIALFLEEVVRAEGTIEFDQVCNSTVFSDGYCNVKASGTVPNHGDFKSLDRTTFRKSVKDPQINYASYGRLNPITKESKILLAGHYGDYPPMKGGGGTINITLKPGEKTPIQRLTLEPVNDSLWYELDKESSEAGGVGPRGAWLEFVCEN